MDDFYDLLEVSEDATQSDIKRAWRGKAREYHPDVNDDARANAQFKTLQKAYEVLSDETERAAYDRLGHTTYVNQRLDGLPTAGMTRPDDTSTGGTRWSSNSSVSSSRSNTSNTANRTQSSGNTSSRTASGRTSSGSSRKGSSGSSQKGSSGSSQKGSSGSSRTRSSGSRTRSQSGGRSQSSDRSSSNGGSSSRTRSSSHRQSGSSTNADKSAGTNEEVGTATATRNPLWYGWTATLLAGVIYLGGLAVFLDANVSALAAFASALSTNPQAALLAGHGIVEPGTFALSALTVAPGLALAFPASAALLGLVFLGVVGKFGHGTAYLYLLGALAPLASLALGPAVSVSAAGLTLTLVVLLPIVATTLFLADVGRYLLADA
ncbi:DnaJ domain-containing protein [Halogeometricum borinquense]|uniref:DnaJ domain-containing protein n=1 Tax=Halogeometricum borinquense TaxID=60847 RepID=A0A6C0UIH9_9EURY|nr:DnaJ domain-containing protein [Halogeometricum borinquense]QIB73639.1 DnaJ domain-containing protein [Halogeometricum borinquense]